MLCNGLALSGTAGMTLLLPSPMAGSFATCHPVPGWALLGLTPVTRTALALSMLGPMLSHRAVMFNAMRDGYFVEIDRSKGRLCYFLASLRARVGLKTLPISSQIKNKERTSPAVDECRSPPGASESPM